MTQKIENMKKLEKAGLSFTANVIMNGCSKPATKMKKIVSFIEAGMDVRHSQFETMAIVVDGKLVWIWEL